MNSSAIKEWMKLNNMTAEELSVLLKVSFYTVRKMLSGQKVNDSLIELLSLKTGISTEVLLTRIAE